MKKNREKPNHLKSIIFIEHLTIISWILSVLPYLIRKDLKGRKIYYIDSSRAGLCVASFSILFLSLKLEKLNFRMVDIRDEEGNLLRLRMAYFDFAEVQKDILSNPVFKNIDSLKNKENEIDTFLAKRVASFDHHVNSTVWRAQYLVHIAAWKTKKENPDKLTQSVLFMNKRVWFKEIKQYASKYNVEIIPTRNMLLSFKNIAVLLAGSKIKIFQSMYFYIKKEGISRFIKQFFIHKYNGVGEHKPASPKLAATYYGHLNLEKPQLHSDLFFWQQSQLSGDDILIAFGIPRDPLDNKKLQSIKKHGMSAVVVSPAATRINEAPMFYSWLYKPKFNIAKITKKLPQFTSEERWLKQQISYYFVLYNHWFSFFDQYDVKIYISWYKYDATQCIIADALRHSGGLSIMYQRAFEEFSSPETATICDVFFGSSAKQAKVEYDSGSHIPYYVITGYVGDHRFSLLKNEAQKIRLNLQKNGAKRILAFFDENSGDDSRWHTGHEFMRVNYEVLFEKILTESDLGIVFKPKVPSTLRKRLGKIADLLKRAESTGRCFVFEGGTLHGSYPPAVAALAADIAIHGDLAGATAGVEAALAGVPTLLLDREGWPISSFYKVDKSKIAFNNWPELWEACREYWNNPKGIPELGNWSSILDELDPFRDGRAAERAGTYLKWLLDGFKSKLDRDTVMADAAERYCKIWGKDKVIEIN